MLTDQSPEEAHRDLAELRGRALAITRTAVLPLPGGEMLPVAVVDRRHTGDLARVVRAVDRGANPVPRVGWDVVVSRVPGEPSWLGLRVEVPPPAPWRFVLLLALPRHAAFVRAVIGFAGLVVAPPSARTAADAARFGLGVPMDAGQELGAHLVAAGVWRAAATEG